MRRTVIIFVIAAFLFGSAAYGSKKPRVSAASTASHKKALHSARRAPERGSLRRTSATHTFGFHHWRKASPVVRSHASLETDIAAEPNSESPVAASPAVESASIHKSHVLTASPLRGSRESLVRQNEKSEDADGLERIEDDDDLNDRIASGMLVPVPVSAVLSVNNSLPENRRYCRPWTATFLSDLSRAHATQFRTPLLVTSAVRTVEYQKQLERINGNAASAEGDIASPHLTGATIDIAKQGLSRPEITWMRSRLLALQNAGKIDVEEEFRQSCFHITVYRSYVPAKPEGAAPALAAAAPAEPAAGKTSSKLKKSVRQKRPHTTPDQPKPEQQSPASAPLQETPIEG
ncbi:MAG: DUF5715 family protein [Terracidiphilus sp.]|jgi:hypothetical protein